MVKHTIIVLAFLFIGISSFGQTLKTLNWKGTPSGLEYYIPFRSISDTVIPMKTVVVQYITFLKDDVKAIFPESEKLKSEEIKLNEFIPGFAQAVRMLGVGEEGFFKVPPALAYGDKSGEYKDTVFYFYIKLVEIKN